MYPDDRVLVCFVPTPEDFERILQKGWYRIPEQHAPKGLRAEYFAFYFGRNFGPEKWAIHYYARQKGYELFKRRDLFPDETNHPRADNLYYKVALGPIRKLGQPIASLRWRRITFLHTTWDRFKEAREINDLLLEGGEFLDRLAIALKEKGLRVERNYTVREHSGTYRIPLVLKCQNGRIEVYENQVPPSVGDVERLVGEIQAEVQERGGQPATE